MTEQETAETGKDIGQVLHGPFCGRFVPGPDEIDEILAELGIERTAEHPDFDMEPEEDPEEGFELEGTEVDGQAVILGATLARFVLNRGPAPIGVSWHEGMDRVDSEGYIYPTGRVRGGHCAIIDGVVFGVEGAVDRFRLRNSWGSSWGLSGRCRIRVEDLQRLFSAGGTACMAVDL